MLSIPVIFTLIALALVIGNAFGKVPPYAWGFVICLVLLLMLL
jgi:hypothetical protein